MNVAEKYFLIHRIDELAEEVRNIIAHIYTVTEPKNQEAVDECMRVGGSLVKFKHQVESIDVQ